MAKKTNPEVVVNEEEVLEEEFVPEIEVTEEQPQTEPKKKTTVKSVLKKVGTGSGSGVLLGASYMLGVRSGKKTTEEEPLYLTEKEKEEEPIEVTEF